MMFKANDDELEIIEMCLKCCRDQVGDQRAEQQDFKSFAAVKAKNEVTLLLMRIARYREIRSGRSAKSILQGGN